MAKLPSDRVSGDLPPFTSTGIDFFGPFMVSRGRGLTQEKRYGVVFSCLASRACHLEVACSLDTDSFINAMRRFFCRRGTSSIVRSDNATNLVSGNKEINKSIEKWNEKRILNFCNQKGIEWKFNPPYSSHYGGVYEREIRTTRKILNALLSEHSNKLRITDEMLSTLMCEVENTLNSRPLGSVIVNGEPEPLTPNHILRLNTNVMFPPGIFQPSDLYNKRRWRQVQHLADVFWQRWRKEYLPLLIQRQKWSSPSRLHEVGDIVLIVDHMVPRNMWSMGKIVGIIKNTDGHIRSAKITVSTCKDGKNLSISSGIIERPIQKLVLLL